MDAPASTSKTAVNKGFMALTLFLAFVNLPYLLKILLPIHDTSHLFRIFYFFYNDAFYNAQLPQWLPFGFYGFQSSLEFSLISPACLLTGLVGLALRVRDAMLLYNAALLIEQYVMLIGMYRLGRLLFEHEATVMAVCISMICGNVLGTQLGLNFRMFYLIPLVLYFVLLYFRDKRPRDLMAGLIVSLLWFQGVASYVVAVPALAISSVFLGMAVADLRQWREYAAVSRREALTGAVLFALFIAVLGAYYLYLKGSMDEAVLLSPGRNPDFSVTLERFLTFPNTGRLGLGKFMGMVLPYELGTDGFLGFESTTYFGLIPLCLAIYACIAVRGRVLYSLIFSVLMLGLLSVGSMTPVAEALYRWFPLMKYYRHIGYAAAAYKVLIPIIAGFGIDRLITASREFAPKAGAAAMALLSVWVIMAHAIVFFIYQYRSPIVGTAQLIVTAAIIYAALGTVAALYMGLPKKKIGLFVLSCAVLQGVIYALSVFYRAGDVGPFIAQFMLTAAVVYAALWAVYAISLKQRGLALALVLCIALEGLIYQAAIDLRISDITSGLADKNHVTRAGMLGTFKTSPYQYPAVRTDKLSSRRQLDAMAYAGIGSRYDYDYGFIQSDPCTPNLRADVMNSHVHEFIKLRQAASFYDTNDLEARGCSAPKLRVLKGATYAGDDLRQVMSETADISSRPVIYNVPAALRASGGGGEAAMVRYTPNEVLINASAPEGGWLYYADAWHPGWRAYVDGAPSPIYQANMAYKAVRLPKGQSSVRMRFENARERALQYTLVAFGAGMMLWCLTDALLIALARRPRR